MIDQIFTRLLTLPIGLVSLEPGLRSVFAPNPEPADYFERTGGALLLRPSEFMANAQDVAAIYDFVTLQASRLKEIEAPTAIVTGDRDAIVLTHIHSYGSARDIPGATLKVLEGVGHSPHWVAPEVVAQAVVEVAQRAETSAQAGR